MVGNPRPNAHILLKHDVSRKDVHRLQKNPRYNFPFDQLMKRIKLGSRL